MDKTKCQSLGCENRPSFMGKLCHAHENLKLLEKIGTAIIALENIQILGDADYKSDRARRALAEIKAR